jgi:hypothetical protein
MLAMDLVNYEVWSRYEYIIFQGCYTLSQTSNNDNCLTLCCDTDFCNDRCETPTNTTIATTPATTSQTSAPSTKGLYNLTMFDISTTNFRYCICSYGECQH